MYLHSWLLMIGHFILFFNSIFVKVAFVKGGKKWESIFSSFQKISFKNTFSNSVRLVHKESSKVKHRELKLDGAIGDFAEPL